MHIGVVEDNQGLRLMVEMALTLHGHSVETYSGSLSFLSALQKAERNPPFDLVIVDLFLNRRSGIDIVDALRITRAQKIPVMVMSAADEVAFAPIRKRYPSVPILQKPFTIHALLRIINEVTSSVEVA